MAEPSRFEYADPSTRRPKLLPRWHQLDYRYVDFVLIVCFLALVAAIATVL